tara:strand:+ start:41 stop:817 length:777 start_codon:yes stop_codon:yes gene_type:complete
MDRLKQIHQLVEQLGFFDLFEPDPAIRENVEKDLSEQIELLNKENQWIEELGGMKSFLDSIEKLEVDYSAQNGSNKKKVLKIVLDQLKHQSVDMIKKTGLWEYFNEENIKLAHNLQNKKLKYLLESFREIGVFCQDVEDIHDLVTKESKLIELGSSNSSSNYLTEEEKRSNKLKLAILFKLGVIDHLKKIDSLKDNDSIISRVLASFLGGKKDTYQPYLSAAKNNPKSSSSQNNPLSDKLIEEAEIVLERAGVNLNDL